MSQRAQLKMIKMIGICEAVCHHNESVCTYFAEAGLYMKNDRAYKEFADCTKTLFNQSVFLRNLIRERVEIYSDLFIKCEKDKEDAETMVCSIVNLYLKKISAMHDKAGHKICMKEFFEEAESLDKELEGWFIE